MPVRKFRSVEEMPSPPPGRPLDPENLRQTFRLIGLLYRLRPWRFKPGVYKYRSLEEAKAGREAQEQADRRG